MNQPVALMQENAFQYQRPELLTCVIPHYVIPAKAGSSFSRRFAVNGH